MIRKAKRSSAANHEGSGLPGSLFGRSAFANTAVSGDAKGTTTPSARLPLSLALLVAMLFSLALVGTASAAKVHPFKETLGGGTPPTFAKPQSIAVDQSSGDVLVLDGGANEVQSLKVAATSGQFKLTFGGQTTGWTGTGTLSPSSTSVTGLGTITGNISKGEVITGTGIKPNTTITACAPTTCIAPLTSITLSQTTEASAGGAQSLSAEIPFNISAANLREALEKLSSIGVISPSKLAVAGGPGNAGGTTPYTITFQNGLGGRDVEQITASNGASPLSGGSPSSEAAVTTTTPGVTSGIRRFNPDGSAANFSALGTNVIDGQKGPGGKTRAECETAPEPASCDETPQNGFIIGTAAEVQIAVDNSGGVATGNIYLTQYPSKLVDVFAADGHFLGQLTKYKQGASASGPEQTFEPCGVSVGPTGAVYVAEFPNQVHKYVPSANPPVTNDNTANFASSHPCIVAAGTGPTAGYIFVTKERGPITKLDNTTGEFQYTVASGANTTETVDPTSGQVLAASGSIVTEYDASGATSAVQASTLTAASTVQGLAVRGATGNVYLSRTGSSTIDVFGPPVSTPTVVPFDATGITPTDAVLNGAVSTEANPIEECVFEYGTTTAYGKTATCSGSIPVDNKLHPVSASIGALEPETTYHFRIKAKNAVGTTESADKTLVTSRRVITEAATGIGDGPATMDASATLNGRVHPVGAQLTACKFEYLTQADYFANGQSYSGSKVPQTKSCTPAAASIAPDFQYHAVSGAITGLAESTTYHFRLSATSASGTFTGEDLSFTTQGQPLISEELPLWVDKTTAILRAKVNPNGSATSYHFEWGTDTSYGKRIPADFDTSIGSGTGPVTVKAELSGLDIGTDYHFRVVATNSSGTVAGPDQGFETLNSFDLTNDRGIELVSPADKRPVGNVARLGTNQLYYQAAENGEVIGYPILNGLVDSSAGGETIYAASRSSNSWLSTEVTPPSLIPSPVGGDNTLAKSGSVRYYSPEDLKCAIVETHNPLTADTPLADVENGVFNLYRWTADSDSYTLISNRIPLNPTAVNSTAPYYQVAGASSDCSRIFFRSAIYSFIPNASGLYEWDKGMLRDAGLGPDHTVPGGAVGALVASAKNTVSPSGRLFFTATSHELTDSGKPAVFVRKNSTETLDVSRPVIGASQPTLGAQYETASPDGSHVFFLANYGIGPNSSSISPEDCSTVSGPSVKKCDLYSYDVESEQLTDLSADINPVDVGGAMVQGVLDISNDGSTVYFAARGQLVPGGRTSAENLQGQKFANIYRWQAGTPPTLTYVGSLANKDLNESAGESALIHSPAFWNAQTTANGGYLLFISHDNITGTNPNQVAEAYLYSAETSTTECVSCPRDGSAPHAYGPQVIQQQTSSVGFSDYTPRSLSEDGRVIFTVEDALAPGAVEGQGHGLAQLFEPENNIYEWYKGQVSLLASGHVQMIDMGGPDGRDVFIKAYEQLDPRDFDFNADVYDFRAGGGFAPPAQPPTPCDPAADQCQGASSSVPSFPTPMTSDTVGSGNPPLSPVKRHHIKKHHRKKNHKKHHKKSHGRAANVNSGGTK